MLHKTLAQMTSSLLHRNGDAADLIEAGAFTPEQYLQLHRNNIYVSLTEALAAIYPVVSRLVGEDFFAAACREFIPKHPPRAAPMLEFGAEFADFLEEYEPAKSLIYIADVARLEWAWHESFHAADAKPFNASSLTDIDEAKHGKLKFKLHPSVRLLRSGFPIYRIWHTNQEGFTGENNVHLDEGGDHILVNRSADRVQVVSIDVSEWLFLHDFARGYDLDTAYARALSADAGFDLDRSLQSAIANNIIVQFIS